MPMRASSRESRHIETTLFPDADLHNLPCAIYIIHSVHAEHVGSTVAIMGILEACRLDLLRGHEGPVAKATG